MTSNDTSEPVVAQCRTGAVRGSTSKGIHSFKGIPYAGPTHGPGRFRPPVPVAPWSGVLDATTFGPACPQIPWSGQDTLAPEELDLLGYPREPEPQDEACLVLNVWTPAVQDGGRRPVMVWLHGGAHSFGSGSFPGFDGTSLATRGDVVVITVNHRVGVLGYLHLADLSPDAYPLSGNVGMLDLVEALRWVRDNVEAFGGDPDNVTIFGESGGGTKVSLLLTMPAADGLFHRAIVQSGPAWNGLTRADATTLARQLLDELELGPDQVDELATVPVERLLAAQDVVCQRVLASGGMKGGLGFSPVVDGDVLPDPVVARIAAGAGASVPLLIGTTKDETLNLLLWGPPMELDATSLPGVVGMTLHADDIDVAHIVDVYTRTRPGATAFELFAAILSDRNMRLGSITLAEAKATAGPAPVFMYLFAWESPARDGIYKASHGMEVPFVFDNTKRAPIAQGEGSDALAASMSDAWIAFARDGDPNHSGLPKWPPYSVDERATMVFDTHSRIVNDYDAEERLAWGGLDGAI